MRVVLDPNVRHEINVVLEPDKLNQSGFGLG
jgi:hypothetical protein